MTRAKRGRGSPQQLRIIGGQWRGQKLKFAAAPGLRPTADSIRETLFNWLMNDIDGAYCLDPFAGSGAIGLEALSRGAAEVVMLDANPKVVTTLKEQLRKLNATTGAAKNAEALSWLKRHPPDQPYDIIFLDPPFREELLQPVLVKLNSPLWVKPGTLIYFEQELDTPLPDLPAHWTITRQKEQGQVRYGLIEIGQ